VPSSNPIGLAVHGSFVGSDGIQGNAVNDLGLTFTFNGQLKRACLDNATYYPDQNPYAAAPAIPVQFEPGRGSLAGQGYVVELYGSATPQECLYFGIDGTLSRGNGANQNWGMDRLNSKRGTFQAVGSIVQGTAGRALRGERSSLGELRVHGIESDAAGCARSSARGAGPITASTDQTVCGKRQREFLRHVRDPAPVAGTSVADGTGRGCIPRCAARGIGVKIASAPALPGRRLPQRGGGTACSRH
jgi:hypothetical protein